MKLSASPILATQLPGGDFVATEPPRIVDGVPRRIYAKDIIRTGRFVKAEDELSFEVDERLLDHWVRTFEAMQKVGVSVPVVAGHDGANDPDAVRGRVLSLWRDGDRLVMRAEMVGEDGILAAERSDVSIYSPPDFTDGEGNEYTQPILHVALTPNPVIPGLGAFIPLAASRRLKLAQEPAIMDALKKIAAALGIAEEDLADETKAEELIIAAIGKLADSKKVEASLDTPEPKDDGASPAIEASRKVDPLTVRLVADANRTKLGALVSAGKITPAVRDKLEAELIGKDGAALALSLSKGDENRTFDAVVAALADNDPVKLAEQTKAQVLSLSDGRKGDGGADDKLRAAMERQNKRAGAKG